MIISQATIAQRKLPKAELAQKAISLLSGDSDSEPKIIPVKNLTRPLYEMPQ